MEKGSFPLPFGEGQGEGFHFKIENWEVFCYLNFQSFFLPRKYERNEKYESYENTKCRMARLKTDKPVLLNLMKA